MISPAGYYKFDEEEDGGNGVDGGNSILSRTILMIKGSRGSIMLNPEFEWPTQDALLKIDNWVHHVPYLLPQGRAVFMPAVTPFDSSASSENNEFDEDKEDGRDENGASKEESENGPPLLSNLGDDSGSVCFVSIDLQFLELPGDLMAWSIRLCSTCAPVRYSPVCLRSNRWPGAVSIGYNDKFANIYMGWGLKETGHVHVPAPLPPIQLEYGSSEASPDSAANIVEQADPTFEEEQATEAAAKAQSLQENPDGAGDDDSKEED